MTACSINATFKPHYSLVAPSPPAPPPRSVSHLQHWVDACECCECVATLAQVTPRGQQTHSTWQAQLLLTQPLQQGQREPTTFRMQRMNTGKAVSSVLQIMSARCAGY